MAITIPTITQGDDGVTARTSIDANFQDLDSRLSSEETKEAYDFLVMSLQGSVPSVSEGATYNLDGLKYQTDVSSFVVDLLSNVMPVRNTSGAIISKGQPCRHNGVSQGRPLVELAQANTFTNARVLGLAGHDIPNNSNGYLIENGTVDFDTTGLTSGLPIYLDDVVAGGFTVLSPDILTQVGGTLVQSTTGSFRVKISNNINLPSIGGLFQGTSVPIAIDSTIREFSNFDLTESLVVDASSGDSFIVPEDGLYSMAIVMSISNINPHNNGHIIDIMFYNKSTATNLLFPFRMIVGRNDDVASVRFAGMVQLSSGDEVSFRYQEETSNNVDGNGLIQIDGIQVSIESKQIR